MAFLPGEDPGLCMSRGEEGDDDFGALFSALLAEDRPSSINSPEDASERRRLRRRSTKVAGDGDGRKRRLTDGQVKFLESCFGEEKKLELGRKVRLAAASGLDPKQVAVWFQNRRARHKSKQVADAFLELKSAHDATVLQKCHLENEVLVLKSKLMEAEETIRKLSPGGIVVGGGGEVMAGSPSSPFLAQQPLMADFGEDELLDLQEYDIDDYEHLMEWGFLYGL